MKYPAIIPIGLAAVGIGLLAVVLALGGVMVLYEASDDAFSSEHKDSGTLSVMTTEEAETILPLMADIISQSSNVVIEIDAKDFAYSGRELSSYENLVNRLKANNAKIKLSDSSIADFQQSADDLGVALEVLNADVARMEALKKEITANAGNTSALLSLYSEVQALSREITLTADTYAETAEIMIEISKGYNLDTSQLVWAIEKVNAIADVAIRDAGSVGGSSGGASLQILFTLSDDTLAYGDTLTIEGSSRLSGLHEIYLDSGVWGTFDLSAPGTFTKSFKIGQVTDGLHIITIRSGGQVSKLGYITIESTPTVLAISPKVSGNTVTILGGLQTDGGISVSNAEVFVYADGIGILSNATTNANGAFSVETELEDGEYQIYAEFSDNSFPLDPSTSEPVTVKISNPLLFVILGLGVAGIAAFGVIRFMRKRRVTQIVGKQSPISLVKESPVRPSPAATIKKAIKRIIGTAVRKDDTDVLRILYRETVSVIAAYEGIENAEVKTPREILREIADATEDVKEFMSEYEYLHYADVPVTESDMARMRDTAMRISEAYHENTE